MFAQRLSSPNATLIGISATTLLVTGVALMLLACGVGGGATSAEPATGGVAVSDTPLQAVPIGQPVDVTERIVDQVVTRVTVSAPTTTKGGTYERPQRGQYLVATVTVEAREGKSSVSSGDFKIITADGTTYPTTYCSAATPDLSIVSLAPGQKSAGLICFDIPQGSNTGARIAMTSFLAERDIATWAL